MLVASTAINDADMAYRGPFCTSVMDRGEGTDAEYLTEFAGRACYESFHRPNPSTADTRDYVRATLFEKGHWSIAEHATATLYFTGVSRAFTHELIRHRHLSYSQLSQRFVDESEANIVLPPALRKPPRAPEELEARSAASNALDAYDYIVDALVYDQLVGAAQLLRKQAREAARAVLPNMIETKIVVTGNLRAWHEVIQRRSAPDADAEMQEVMALAKDRLATVAPTIFGEGAKVA
ncbi:thymidylate synthase (FAD) [Corynebacterium heidelbergense]|uniref:FAD-dependent thymidylate synthase n=2 Tax=Corynebacterium heidelbergense TaxID=2055947 RepID=A0A364VEF8_9CORY|nr:thymidylate synthase (FAD) [Corynebacterium heidelbergense]